MMMKAVSLARSLPNVSRLKSARINIVSDGRDDGNGLPCGLGTDFLVVWKRIWRIETAKVSIFHNDFINSYCFVKTCEIYFVDLSAPHKCEF